MWIDRKTKWKTGALVGGTLLARKWLAEKLMEDLPEYTREKWDSFDPEDLLHTVGLARHRPAASLAWCATARRKNRTQSSQASARLTRSKWSV